MLKNTQQVFWDSITAPEGVPDIDLNPWFKGDEKVPAIKRLNIYANMYFWRIHDAILEDFPELAEKIGKANFNDLMVDYLLEHPSSSPLLQYAGKQLPEFLKKHSLTKKWPSLPEIAELEWTKAMIFESENIPYIRKEDLKKIPVEDWPQIKFKFIPALAILSFKKEIVRVWRHDFKVYHQPIDAKEKRCVELLQSGKTFAEMCEVLGDAGEAASLLADWVESGLIWKIS